MPFDYSIIYSERRSISVSVSSKNEVVVHCPENCPQNIIQDFLKRKNAWIEKVLQKNLTQIEENNDIIALEKIFVEGKKVPLYIGDGSSGIKDDGVHCVVFSQLEFVFNEKFYDGFLEKVRSIAKECGLIPGFTKVKDYSSIWGCCNVGGYVCFNYKVFMLPEDIQRYVIIHELCHLKHMNHSKEYWKLVEKYMPDYREMRKQLKKYDFLTRLY